MSRAVGGLVALALVLGGCGADETAQKPDSAPPRERAALVPAVEKTPEPLPSFAQYEPGPEEKFPNAKRVAGRAAQNLLTYERGTTRAAIAARLGLSAQATQNLAQRLKDAVVPDAASVAEVIYPQMAGTTETTYGAMVVVRQIIQGPSGRRSAVTRTVDVRLQRTDGPWTVQEVASVGGKPFKRPRGLSAAASRLLDDERVTLTDTARWDIFRGGVDPGLLDALSSAAERHPFSVAVLSSGHPRNVWQTDRRSAHSSGYAADIYAVGGRLVVRQPATGSAAHQLASSFAESGVRQLGSPWDFDGPGRTSFTDDVHLDHLHVQRSPVGIAG